eukprot:4404991-Pyramimonas_sp.AAC.1
MDPHWRIRVGRNRPVAGVCIACTTITKLCVGLISLPGSSPPSCVTWPRWGRGEECDNPGERYYHQACRS